MVYLKFPFTVVLQEHAYQNIEKERQKERKKKERKKRKKNRWRHLYLTQQQKTKKGGKKHFQDSINLEYIS